MPNLASLPNDSWGAISGEHLVWGEIRGKQKGHFLSKMALFVRLAGLEPAAFWSAI